MNEKELLASISALFAEQNTKFDIMTNSLTEMRGQLDEVKEQVGKVQAQVDKVQVQVDKVQINQENVIMPRLELLFEGHKGIVSKMDSTAQPDNIQDRVETLEAAVKYLSSEVNRLKKAE